MSKKIWIGIMVGMAVVTALVYSLVLIPKADREAPVTYSGEVLLTEDECMQFKEIVLDPKVQVQELATLSSAPTFIKFVVTAPVDYAFPYGQANPLHDRAFAYLGFPYILVTSFAIGAVYGMGIAAITTKGD